jgi:hypothetical protein
MLDIYRVYAGAYQYASSEERTRMEASLLSQRTHYVEYIKKEALPQIVTVTKLIEAELGQQNGSHVPKIDGKRGVP